jgi:hypothetical protein
MATRSAIAIENSDKSFDVIYCHYDGYPEHHLPILREKYNKAAKVRKLLAKGDISILETEKTWMGTTRKPQPLYYYERGETSVDARNVCLKELREFADGSGCEYLYTYLPRWGWKFEKI